MGDYNVGAYIRLSKEDERNGESESVINQRNFIKEYLCHHGLSLQEEYIDDGFTGTSFDRPGFNRMIKDIEENKINMVVTKDLSRLGRDYIKSGYYIEDYFPRKRVRYVSILDNVDTVSNKVGNDFAPFRALFNDMVSKDTSRKIKSILESKKRNGLYLSSKAPFGYKKVSKYNLLIDEKEANIVKDIFNMFLGGFSINEIVCVLNQRKIKTPSKGDKWSYISVYNILKNRVYLGMTVQNVWTTLSYKNKIRIKKPEKYWIIKKNYHKPLVEEKDFNDVQRKLKHRNVRSIKKREKLLLEGFVYCYECNHLMGVNVKKNNVFLICNGYKKNTSSCTPHYMNYKKFEDEVVLRVTHEIEDSRGNDISKWRICDLIDRITVDKDKNIYIKYKKAN